MRRSRDKERAGRSASCRVSASGVLVVWGVASVLLAGGAAGQAAATKMPVVSGAPPATVSGELRAGEMRDYSVTARAGETLGVSLPHAETPGPGVVVTVMRVKDGVASFVGQSSADGVWSGRLPEDGEYVIRVVRDPSAGNHAERAIRYTLSVALNP